MKGKAVAFVERVVTQSSCRSAGFESKPENTRRIKMSKTSRLDVTFVT